MVDIAILRFVMIIKFNRLQNKRVQNDFTFPDNTSISFINLDCRKDRLESITNQFTKLGLKDYTRISGINKKNGMEGVTLSHIRALTSEENRYSDLIMVCEDDAIFHTNYKNLIQIINSFAFDDKLDILCLGYNEKNRFRYNELFDITTDTQTTVCYVVKQDVKDRLVWLFELAYQLQINNIDDQIGSALDVVWKRLQKRYAFAIPKTHIVTQLPSISDSGSTPHFVNHGV
jgi:GR25 family glycosyltransferase involved in LPS biosynthesis